MFDINAYSRGYTVIEATEINSSGRIIREIAPIRHDQAMEAGQAPVFTREDAEALAGALNAAEKLIYTVTRTTETTGDDSSPNQSLSHRSNKQTETVVHTFKGPGAQARALAAYNAENDRLRLRGKWPGYVTTISLDAAIHSIAFTEI